jgi:hypothetical protein
MERGAPVPAWVDEEPDAEPGDSFYMESFWELSTERQLGFTVGPIPITAIHFYAGVKGLPSSMMGLFEAVIRAMDQTYLKWAEETRKKAAKNSRGAAQSHIGETRTRQAKT